MNGKTHSSGDTINNISYDAVAADINNNNINSGNNNKKY